MKKKRGLIVIIVVLMLILLAGGAFAYVYFATDLLRTDKEMFFKYFSQIATEGQFIDSRIQQYNEKKQQTPYENSGEITFQVEYPEDESINEEILKKVNDLSIRFSGQTDLLEQKVEKKIEVDYGNDVIFPVKYRQDGNKFGLQFDKISSKFIAIRNENLDELIEKFSGDGIVSMPSKIEGISDIFENTELNFSDDEKNQLKQIYGTVLQEQLVAENFSSAKIEQGESYSLELNGEQIKNIIIKILEITKENTLIIDKMNEMILANDSEAEIIDVNEIDTIIESVNEEDFSQILNFKLTLEQSNKMLNKIIIEYGEEYGEIKIIITKNNAEDSLEYKIKCDITEITSALESSESEDEESEETQYNLYFNIQYSGLNELNNIQENYEIGYAYSINEQSMKCDYKISSNNEFKDSVSIEELNSNVAVFLNDHNAEVITNFMSQVGTRLLEVNKNQMQELGLEEYENPLLYSNPITLLVLTNLSVYNAANNAIEDVTDLSEYEIQQHNAKFEIYVGEELRGSEVNAMIKTIQNSNLMNEDVETSNKNVKIILDGIEMTQVEKVDTSKTYVVEAIYGTEGFIIEMKVTTNN